MLGVGLGLYPATQALQGDVGAAVAEHHQDGRDALALQLGGLRMGHLQGRRQGGATAAGQAGQGAAGAQQ